MYSERAERGTLLLKASSILVSETHTLRGRVVVHVARASLILLQHRQLGPLKVSPRFICILCARDDDKRQDGYIFVRYA